MSVIKLKSFIAKSCALVVLFVALLSTSAFAGRDFYEVYLNNKLIKKQFVGEATTGLMDLQLDKSNLNDKLVITYFHCNTKGAGKGRNITVKNAQHQVVKEWKFADPTGSDVSMSIPVKDILDLQKNNPTGTLSIYYFSSAELPAGLMLAAVKPTGKSVSYLHNVKNILPEFADMIVQQMTFGLVPACYTGSFKSTVIG